MVERGQLFRPGGGRPERRRPMAQRQAGRLIAMENADKPANTEAAITQPRDNWWIQLIRYAKSKMDERAAKKQKEPPTDRAARVAARATVWIAIFTLVSVAVSVFTFVILRRQLKEMHDGGVDTHTLAQQA